MKDVTIDGYVTKNVETRSTQGGQLVTRFSVNSPSYNRESRTSAPQFFECEYWHSGQNDDKARNIVEGALLLLWGSLAYDSWQDRQTGQNRSKAYIKVREIGVIRPPQPKQNQAQGYRQACYAPQQVPASRYGSQQPAPVQQQAAYAPQQAAQQYLYDEDIPF